MKKFWMSLGMGFLLVNGGLGYSYDQVQNEKTILFAIKKTEPSTLRIDKDGGFWILDKDTSSIQKISKDGKIEKILKPGKKNDSLFKEPVDFVFLSNGSMAVADLGLNRITFINDGKLLSQFPCEGPVALAASHDDVLAIALKDKSLNIYSLDGVLLHSLYLPSKSEFKSITSMAYALDGTLWVLDGDGEKVHRFAPDRKYLGGIDGFPSGQSIVVDEYGFAYVTMHEGRWKEIDKEGTVSGTFGTKGKNPGQMVSPTGVALVGSDFLWVAETGNVRLQSFRIVNQEKKSKLMSAPASRIQVRLQSKWEGHVDSAIMNDQGDLLVLNADKKHFEWLDSSGKTKSEWSKKKKGQEGFSEPVFVTQDSTGGIWVSDEGDHSIKHVSVDGEILQRVGEKGKKEGNLKSPSFVSIRKDLSVVVADKDNTRVQVLNKKGIFLFAVGSKGKNKGQFQTVSGLATSETLIALIDNERKALLFYDSTGKFLSETANKEGAAPVWKELSGLASDGDGRFYVLDKVSKRVRVFDAKARFVADFSVEGSLLVCGPHNAVLVMGEKEFVQYAVYFVPKAVENLKVEDSDGDIKIEWDKNPDADQYRVYRSTLANEYVLMFTTNTNVMVDVQITPGVTYRYAVAGINVVSTEGNWTQGEPLKGARKKNVSLVSISSVTLNPVFSAAFKYYVDKPIGTINIRNNSDLPFRDVKLSLTLKDYTDFATEKIIPNLAPGESIPVPVSVTFNENILELSENTPIQVDVKVSYFDENQEKIVSQNAPLTIYSRNAISWLDKNRMASFITPKDPPVVDFSRDAVKQFLPQLKGSTVGRPLAKAALLYEAINAVGITYVPDPKTPFAEASTNPDVLDYVQFPRETLRRKTGDCDDTTALLASLLTSIGVEVALVDMPGHIFLMVNLEENDPSILGIPVERFVDYKGTFWVPVETTKLGKSFPDAWQAAISTIKNSKDKDKITYIPVLEAQEKYPPVTILDKEQNPSEFPKEKLEASFPPILNELQSERYKNQLAEVKELIKASPDNDMLQVKLAMVHVEGGKISEAKKIFDDLLKNPAGEIQAAANNNLGNLAYLSGDYKTALKHYDDAAILSPDDGGVAINRARAAWQLGDNTTAKKHLLEAKDLMPDWNEYVTDFPAEVLPK